MTQHSCATAISWIGLTGEPLGQFPGAREPARSLPTSTVRALFRPVKELPDIVRVLLAPGAGESVLATLATAEGSSYRRPGARLLIAADGVRIGSISGGCLEEDVIARASRVLATGQAETVVYDTTSENDLVWGVGLGCHGVVRVLIEKLPARPAWAVALAENIQARRPTRLAVVHGTADHVAPGTYLASDAAIKTRSTAEIFFDTIAP